uniref:Uncharacterized protein n=1 Tax=Schistosoma mansoni TaxID=6183 RepID=A0A5K4F8W0_SCHMA
MQFCVGLSHRHSSHSKSNQRNVFLFRQEINLMNLIRIAQNFQSQITNALNFVHGNHLDEIKLSVDKLV